MDKVCVITGGALGIGKELVKKFAEEGYKVIFIDNNKEAISKTEKEFRHDKLNVEGYFGDIAEESVLKELSLILINKYEKINVLINNACISRKGIISECSFDDFNYVLKIGVTAPYMLSLLFKNNFAKGGAILNISSTRAFMSQRDTESYTAAKGGIAALTHGLAVSLSGKVRVNSISPGWIDTYESYGMEEPKYSDGDLNQHLSKRVGVPKDIARAALFLCDEKNSFITGENINVDGGMTKLMIYHDDFGWNYDEK